MNEIELFFNVWQFTAGITLSLLYLSHQNNDPGEIGF